jgi:subtilisin family serine protease
MTFYAPGIWITAGGRTYAGTSQATPHVAGAIAVLQAAKPSASLGEIVSALRASGRPVRVPKSGWVVPRVDVEAAAMQLAHRCSARRCRATPSRRRGWRCRSTAAPRARARWR